MSQSKFYVSDGYKNSTSKIPPTKPSNKPICLGDTDDEKIVALTKYEFSVDPQMLVINSKNTRRAKRNNVGPPRPQNPFMLYRRDKFKKHKHEYASRKLKSSEISKIIGEMWEKEDNEVKALFRALARMAEKLHSEEHGEGYKFRPKQKKGRTISDNESTSDSKESNVSSPNSDVTIDSDSNDDEMYSPISDCSDNFGLNPPSVDNLSLGFCGLNEIEINPVIEPTFNNCNMNDINFNLNTPTEPTFGDATMNPQPMPTTLDHNNLDNSIPLNMNPQPTLTTFDCDTLPIPNYGTQSAFGNNVGLEAPDEIYQFLAFANNFHKNSIGLSTSDNFYQFLTFAYYLYNYCKITHNFTSTTNEFVPFVPETTVDTNEDERFLGSAFLNEEYSDGFF